MSERMIRSTVSDKKFGIDYRLIAKRNRISYPYKIYVGQRLYIDRRAPRGADLNATHIRNAPKPKKRVKRTSPKRKQ